jgi:uncharacterized protein (TIGR03032 family)
MERQPNACDVFISYAGFDRDVAAALATSLESANVGMWWDAHLSPDEPFEQQIQRVLSATKLIVAIFSPQTLTSEWVRWELSQASQNGLHIVPVLVDGVRAEQLPPPLHLLPSLTLPSQETTPALMQEVATQIRHLVQTLNRRPARRRENDARRRLASAAADIARQAAGIRYRKTQALPRPPIIVGNFRHHTEPEEPGTRYTMSEGFVSFLEQQNISIAFSSFQSGELFLAGRAPTGELMVNIEKFRKPTGLHVFGDTLLMATLGHVYRMENILGTEQWLDGAYSHCYVPRIGHFTGVLDTHDVGMTCAGEAIFIATRCNCLAGVSSVHSFKPIWRPFFISDVVAEDRCHLNGLAMRNGSPAYVTAVSRSNTYDEWRQHVSSGGIVVDVQANAIVCGQLSMPHSPRVYDTALWLLNSGTGELGYVDDVETGEGRFRPTTFCPGFARGLAFHRGYAVVGLSRPRYDNFAGLPLAQRLRDSGDDAWCGIQVIDLKSGRCVHWFRLEGSVRELYDVVVLPDVPCPRSVGDVDEEALDLITIETREL